jgi:hypothetical protein
MLPLEKEFTDTYFATITLYEYPATDAHNYFLLTERSKGYIYLRK